MTRDSVPAPLFFDLQSAIFPRGRYEDALASSTGPCGFCLSGLVPIALGQFSLSLAFGLCCLFIYKVTTLGFGFFFWLHQCLNTTSYV